VIAKRVATPHGSDKNATLQKLSIKQFNINFVATPHGSDKNATWCREQGLGIDNEGCNSPRVR